MTPPRVLSISHSYVVGLNRALPNALARLGWDVTVVAPEFFPGDLRPITLEFEGLDAARVIPVRVRAAGHHQFMTWTRDLRRLLREDWAIVHAWEEPYIPAGAQIARWRRGGRLVFASFQNLAKRYPPPFNWIERYALARADAWIAFGVTVEQTLRTRPGYARLPHRVIPPALDLDRFAPDADARDAIRRELGFSPDDGVVGFAGRFVPEKGLRILMAALDRMTLPWRALFVGGGPLERELRAWSARQSGRACLATNVTHGRMARYLNGMDLLAVPSLTTRRWREQFGRIIVEAMACGIPVVGSRSGEIPHVIADAGVVVAERNPDALAAAIETLLKEAARRRQLSLAGLERARDFASDRTAAAHAAFFKELLAPS